MDCKSLRTEIEEASRGAAAGAWAAAHLADCAGCREFSAERAALRGLVAGLPRVDAPNDFEFRLRARLAAERQAVGRAGWPALAARAGWPTFATRAAWAAGLAGCLVLAAAVSLRVWETTPAGADADQSPSQAAQAAPSAPESTQPAPAAPSAVAEQPGRTSNDALSTGVEVATATAPGLIESVESVESDEMRGTKVARESGVGRGGAGKRQRRHVVVPRGAAEELARGVGVRPPAFEEHSRSVIAGTIIALPVAGEEQPLQVTFKDLRGGSRVVRVEPVAFGSREPAGATGGARVVNASHKQGVW